MTIAAAVIVDIVGSRKLADRSAAQEAVRVAFARADRIVPPVMPLWSTAGDEFQVVYDSAPAANVATTVVRLALPTGLDLRFGVGLGESHVVEATGESGPVLDGSAWWNARAAIEEAERRGGRSASARTWLKTDDGDPPCTDAALLLRDHIISHMRDRERRICLGLIEGALQAEIADSEGISQSAVSQSARRSGASALVQAVSLWRASVPV